MISMDQKNRLGFLDWVVLPASNLPLLNQLLALMPALENINRNFSFETPNEYVRQKTIYTAPNSPLDSM